MTHVTYRLTANYRDQLQNPMLGNRVWATFTFFSNDGSSRSIAPTNANTRTHKITEATERPLHAGSFSQQCMNKAVYVLCATVHSHGALERKQLGLKSALQCFYRATPC